MTNETLRERVAAILTANDAAGTGPLSEQEYRDDAEAVLAAIGLDDWEAAVERMQRAIVASVDEYVEWNIRAYGKPHTGEGDDTEFICTDAAKKALAALTQPTDPVIPSSTERESRG